MTDSMEKPSRRAALGALASVPVLALPVGAIAAPAGDARRYFRPGVLEGGLRIFAREADGDAEIIALSDEILRIHALAEEVAEKGIHPFRERFDQIMGMDGLKPVTDESIAAGFAYRREVGMDAANDEVNALDDQNGPLFARMMSIPATTQPGRAAKVRALIIHVLRTEWRGPGRDLDWEIEMPRKLLGEFAGMTEEELANV
jgi:hypothetical protein